MEHLTGRLLLSPPSSSRTKAHARSEAPSWQRPAAEALRPEGGARENALKGQLWTLLQIIGVCLGYNVRVASDLLLLINEILPLGPLWPRDGGGIRATFDQKAHLSSH